MHFFNYIANDAFIRTICLAIDKTLDNEDKNLHQHNLTLEITHLESYYNYRTVEDDFKLVSSGLSIEEKLAPITAIENKTKNQDPKFIIGDETIIQPIITNFENLYVKKSRIQALIGEMMYANIINKLPISNIQSYFGRDMRPLIPNQIITIKPNYCRDKFQSALKPACIACKMTCHHSIEMILDPVKGLSKEDVLLELKHHFHPKTRILDSVKQRDLSESKRELADHYIYAHNYSEPVFI